MKNIKYTSLFLGLIFMNQVSAQVDIKVDGVGPNVNGTIIDVELNTSMIYPYEKHFHITNNTGSNQQWKITRTHVYGPVEWMDWVCWPPQCFGSDESTTTSNETYITPHSGGNPAPIVVNGSDTTTTGLLAELKPRVTPDQSVNGTSMYMYYITDINGTYIDSVGLRFNFVLGLEDVESDIFTNVYPNPTNDVLYVELIKNEAHTYELVDITGSIVAKGELKQSMNMLNVSDFKRGIYFLNITAGDRKVTKKIVLDK